MSLEDIEMLSNVNLPIFIFIIFVVALLLKEIRLQFKLPRVQHNAYNTNLMHNIYGNIDTIDYILYYTDLLNYFL